MLDVYVYVLPPPCKVLGDLRTVCMEGDANLDYDRDDGSLVGVEVLGATLVEIDGQPVSEALDILRDLMAGADDHRCWHVPREIAARARSLLATAKEAGDA